MLPVAGSATAGHQQGVNCQGRKREKGKEMSVRIGRAGEVGKGEESQGDEGSLLHPPSGFPNKFIIEMSLFFASLL